jgi:hypothetical protein
LNEIKKEYREKLALGEVDLETDLYGCDSKFVTSTGDVMTIADAARDIVPTFMQKYVVTSVDDNFVDDECGVKRKRRRRYLGSTRQRKRVASWQTGGKTIKDKQPPLRKGTKMIDKRTVAGKQLLMESATLSRRDLAARAALARFSTTSTVSDSIETKNNSKKKDYSMENNNATIDSDDDDSKESDEDDDDYGSIIRPHLDNCLCRSCDWDRLLFMPPKNSTSIERSN